MIESYRDQYRRDRLPVRDPLCVASAKTAYPTYRSYIIFNISCSCVYRATQRTNLVCAYPGPNLGHAMYWTVVEQNYSKTAELTAIYISD